MNLMDLIVADIQENWNSNQLFEVFLSRRRLLWLEEVLKYYGLHAHEKKIFITMDRESFETPLPVRTWSPRGG